LEVAIPVKVLRREEKEWLGEYDCYKFYVLTYFVTPNPSSLAWKYITSISKVGFVCVNAFIYEFYE